jgi:hypothetical protein
MEFEFQTRNSVDQQIDGEDSIFATFSKQKYFFLKENKGVHYFL